MSIPILNEKQVLDNISIQSNPYFADYYAFYSSWFGGIVKDPSLMLLPMDDHMVHRGDGVFEAMKSLKRSVYLMDEHLQRLARSAEKIELKLPVSLDEMKNIVLETLRAANKNDSIIRLYISRGPGNFSANPYDSLQSQLYIVVAKLNVQAAEKYEHGVIIGKSPVPVKDTWMAQVKSCNYLPNVMMKKNAVDRGLNFVISIDKNGDVAESATENVMIVDKEGIIVHPSLDYILKGTTMIRACELARENGLPTAVRSITEEDLKSAREVMMTGTTLDVLPVVTYENQQIGDGKPGPVAKKLQALILDDMATGPLLTTY